MALFSHLFIKLIPLYFTILGGFLSVRLFNVNRDLIARLLFYVLSPIVLFSAVLKVDLSPALFTVPLFAYGFSSLICLGTYRLSRGLWNDSTPNLLAYGSGCGNTGYFGIPVALLLFDDQTLGIYILLVLGITLYENSLGFYITAKGQFSAKQALFRLLRLPALYAALGGMAAKLLDFQLAPALWQVSELARTLYSILGMAIIGIGLASIHRFKMDWKFLSAALGIKFIAWPVLMVTFVLLDQTYLNWYGSPTHQALLLSSVVPLAANMIVFASILRTYPEKAASAVLISTCIGVGYVPWAYSLVIRVLAKMN